MNTNWGYSKYQQWAKFRNAQAHTATDQAMYPVPGDLDEANYPLMDFWRTRFVQEIRIEDSKPYPPATLYNIICGVQVNIIFIHTHEHKIKLYNNSRLQILLLNMAKHEKEFRRVQK